MNQSGLFSNVLALMFWNVSQLMPTPARVGASFGVSFCFFVICKVPLAFAGMPDVKHENDELTPGGLGCPGVFRAYSPTAAETMSHGPWRCFFQQLAFIFHVVLWFNMF